MSGTDLDAKFARDAWLRALARTAHIEDDPQGTRPVLIDCLAADFGAAPALISREGSLSFRELAARAHQYARWGLAQGLKAGDSVALMMPNRAEYVATWLGLTRIGATVALINTQLSGDALAHCLQIAAPRLIVVGTELASALAPLRLRFRHAAAWVAGESSLGFRSRRSSSALEQFQARRSRAANLTPPRSMRTALYIYTSGTTGLPKAAKVTHYRVMRWSQWFAGLLDTTPGDRMYNCLPLYHSVGGWSRSVPCSSPAGLRCDPAEFSASDFWRDVTEERCTLFQYIGELCRYLVNLPHQPPRRHSLRIACGNGLSPRSLGDLTDAVSDSTDLRVLRLDRRQLLALQLRRPAGSDRPHPLVSGASPAGGAAAFRSRDRGAHPQCGRILRTLRRRRGGRGGRLDF